MYYIVQENTFRESNYDNLIKSLERLDLEYEIVKVLPFTDEVDNKYNIDINKTFSYICCIIKQRKEVKLYI